MEPINPSPFGVLSIIPVSGTASLVFVIVIRLLSSSTVTVIVLFSSSFDPCIVIVEEPLLVSGDSDEPV